MPKPEHPYTPLLSYQLKELHKLLHRIYPGAEEHLLEKYDLDRIEELPQERYEEVMEEAVTFHAIKNKRRK